MIVLFVFITRQDVRPACFPIIALFLCSYNAICSLIFSHFLVSNQSISQNGLRIHRIVVLLYCISAVSLNRMYRSSIAAFHDSYMVTGSVMIPIKKDDVAGARRAVGPATGVFLMGYSLLDAIQNAIPLQTGKADSQS